jgi:hypothetical protein
MSDVNREKILESKVVSNFQYPRQFIENSFFTGSKNNLTTFNDLTEDAKMFLLILVSYQLNFEPNKLDYYFRKAKKIQNLFKIPGWILILPNVKIGNTKKSLRLSIKDLAINFRLEIQNKTVNISYSQAQALNNAYKNFLWE